MASGAPRFDLGRDERVGVMGMPGTGKTTLCRVLAQQMAPSLAWDPFEQYQDLPGVQSYKPGRMWDRRELDKVVAHLWAIPGPCTLVIEEAEQVLEQGTGFSAAMRQYALSGRNLEKQLIVNLRAPQDFEKKVLRVCDRLFIFKLEPASIDYMAARLGKRHQRRLLAMEKWTKDPRRGGGRYMEYRDGDLTEHPPLPRRLATGGQARTR